MLKESHRDCVTNLLFSVPNLLLCWASFLYSCESFVLKNEASNSCNLPMSMEHWGLTSTDSQPFVGCKIFRELSLQKIFKLCDDDPSFSRFSAQRTMTNCLRGYLHVFDINFPFSFNNKSSQRYCQIKLLAKLNRLQFICIFLVYRKQCQQTARIADSKSFRIWCHSNEGNSVKSFLCTQKLSETQSSTKRRWWMRLIPVEGGFQAEKLLPLSKAFIHVTFALHDEISQLHGFMFFTYESSSK